MRPRTALLIALFLLAIWLRPPTLRLIGWLDPFQVCIGYADDTAPSWWCTADLTARPPDQAPSDKTDPPDRKRPTHPKLPRPGWQRSNPTA